MVKTSKRPKRGKGSRPNLKANIIREPLLRHDRKKSIREDVPAWDNFERMYAGFQAGIILHTEYLKRLEDKKIVDAIPDKAGTTKAIRALHVGLLNLQNKLNSVHKKHSGKIGDCDIHDFDLFQTLFMEYDVLRGDYQRDVEPYGEFVMKQIIEAEKVIFSDTDTAGVGEAIKESIIADSEDDAVIDQENSNV